MSIKFLNVAIVHNDVIVIEDKNDKIEKSLKQNTLIGSLKNMHTLFPQNFLTNPLYWNQTIP